MVAGEAVDSVVGEADSAVEADLADLVVAACRAEVVPAVVGSKRGCNGLECDGS